MSRARGIARERQVKALLEKEGWLVVRAAGSLGVCDLVALKADQPTRLVEIKSTNAGPWHSFGPSDRADLALAAVLSGSTAWLCWWPAFKQPVWFQEHEFPGYEEEAA